MFYYLFLICLLINIKSTQQQQQRENQCFLLNTKLNKYNVNINLIQQNSSSFSLCQNLNQQHCCPQIYENHIQNATINEVYHLFELNTINLYEPLIRLNNDLNRTLKNM